jgi:hypothetical protein
MSSLLAREELHQVLQRLSVTTLCSLCSKRKELAIPNTIRKSGKDAIIVHILDHAPLTLLAVMQQVANEKADPCRRKRGHTDETLRRVAQKRDGDDSREVLGGEKDLSKFLELPTEAERKECYRRFYEATSNANVVVEVCAVCARESDLMEKKMQCMPLNGLPNNHRLIPSKPHPAHILYHGRLLEQKGIIDQDSAELIRVCSDCLCDLKKKLEAPPRYSLANNLWIGKTPWVLEQLTLPEQLLIAHIYPRIYVFKLFPKAGRGGAHPDSLQRAMRGTVSSYELSTDGICDMLEGNLMPRSPAILPSIITITYIGVSEPPKQWMRSMFRIRRQAIFGALTWLKQNNPRYYDTIEICHDRLATLPEDDVPAEITSIIRQCTDEGVLDDENDNYVQRDHDPDNGKFSNFTVLIQYSQFRRQRHRWQRIRRTCDASTRRRQQ